MRLVTALNRERLADAATGSFGRRGAPDTVTAETLSLAEIGRRIVEGETLHRSTLLSSLAGSLAEQAGSQNAGRGEVFSAASRAATATHDGKQCAGRVLASPTYDVGLTIALGNRSREEEIAKRLDEAGYKFGPLSDAIVVDSGEIAAGNLLLWANARLLGQGEARARGLVIHFLDEDGNIVGERPVLTSDAVEAAGFPAYWTDIAGPWFEDLWHAVMYGQARLASRQMLRVELKPPKETRSFRIGVLNATPAEGMKWDTLGRPFYVGAIELTRAGEARRFDWDVTQVQRERSVVESFLGPDSGDVALLFPASEYRITAKAHVTMREDGGSPTSLADQQVTYRFRTDNKAPQRLDPWLLAAVPAEAEKHVFAHEHIKVIFATNGIDKLYGAYGLELRARLKAASFSRPDGSSAPHPFPIGPATLQPLGPIVLGPFESALSGLVRNDLPCIAMDEERVRHTLLDIPIPLELFTDYLLDIEAVPVGAAPDAPGTRVYRHSFSTGSFQTLEDFAIDFQATRVEHRGIAEGVLQAIAAEPRFVSGEAMGPEFDEALIGAGLEPMPVPKAARIVVFWQQATAASTPQPAAVLVDASEPMLRRRLLPRTVMITDPDGIDVERHRMVSESWLSLEEDAASALVDRVLYAPGYQRALITLKPGSRGSSLKVDLLRRAFPEIHLDPAGSVDTRHAAISVGLTRAPWEEE